MGTTVYLAAGLLDLSLSLIAEIIAFVLMILILARWVYPRVMAAAEARQRAVAEQLLAAERSREEAEQRLKDAEAQFRDARGQASQIIEGANRSAQQLSA
ncbi:MAG: ATP synthase F0 subunit B, partial [Candidatus Dormibacteraeota bacterium]|nr:ATP synthase F0 subunit B [Candidatus Dormibacteraeota bacterium]